MVKISKQMAQTLAALGFEWHRDITKSASRHPTYYACEKQEVLDKIEELNNRKAANV